MFKHIAFITDTPQAVEYAQRLADAQFDVQGITNESSVRDAFEKAHIKISDSLSSALKQAQIVVTHMAGPLETEELYLKGDEGLLQLAPEHLIALDMSITTPSIAKDIAAAAAAQSILAFDVLTSKDRLYVGADQVKMKDLTPVFEALAPEIVWFGAAGKATAARICEQIALAGALIGLNDALALATQEDLNLDQMVEVLKKSSASHVIELFAQKTVDGDYKGESSTLHLRRDMGIALARSEELEVTLPGTETAYTLLDMLCQIGGASLAPQALQVLYQDEAAAAAAGLDWSDLDSDSLGYVSEANECTDPECSCGHHHDDCCDHDHQGNECTCNHHHAHEDECGCDAHNHEHHCGCNHNHEE